MRLVVDKQVVPATEEKLPTVHPASPKQKDLSHFSDSSRVDNDDAFISDEASTEASTHDKAISSKIPQEMIDALIRFQKKLEELLKDKTDIPPSKQPFTEFSKRPGIETTQLLYNVAVISLEKIPPKFGSLTSISEMLYELIKKGLKIEDEDIKQLFDTLSKICPETWCPNVVDSTSFKAAYYYYEFLNELINLCTQNSGYKFKILNKFNVSKTFEYYRTITAERMNKHLHLYLIETVKEELKPKTEKVYAQYNQVKPQYTQLNGEIYQVYRLLDTKDQTTLKIDDLSTKLPQLITDTVQIYQQVEDIRKNLCAICLPYLGQKKSESKTESKDEAKKEFKEKSKEEFKQEGDPLTQWQSIVAKCIECFKLPDFIVNIPEVLNEVKDIVQDRHEIFTNVKQVHDLQTVLEFYRSHEELGVNYAALIGFNYVAQAYQSIVDKQLIPAEQLLAQESLDNFETYYRSLARLLRQCKNQALFSDISVKEKDLPPSPYRKIKLSRVERAIKGVIPNFRNALETNIHSLLEQLRTDFFSKYESSIADKHKYLRFYRELKLPSRPDEATIESLKEVRDRLISEEKQITEKISELHALSTEIKSCFESKFQNEQNPLLINDRQSILEQNSYSKLEEIISRNLYGKKGGLFNQRSWKNWSSIKRDDSRECEKIIQNRIEELIQIKDQIASEFNAIKEKTKNLLLVNLADPTKAFDIQLFAFANAQGVINEGILAPILKAMEKHRCHSKGQILAQKNRIEILTNILNGDGSNSIERRARTLLMQYFSNFEIEKSNDYLNQLIELTNQNPDPNLNINPKMIIEILTSIGTAKCPDNMPPAEYLKTQKQRAKLVIELLVPALSDIQSVLKLCELLNPIIKPHNQVSDFNYITRKRGIGCGDLGVTATRFAILGVIKQQLQKLAQPNVVLSQNEYQVFYDTMNEHRYWECGFMKSVLKTTKHAKGYIRPEDIAFADKETKSLRNLRT